MGAHATLELSHRGRAILSCRRRHEDDKGFAYSVETAALLGKGLTGDVLAAAPRPLSPFPPTWLRGGGPRQTAGSQIVHRTGHPERLDLVSGSRT